MATKKLVKEAKPPVKSKRKRTPNKPITTRIPFPKTAEKPDDRPTSYDHLPLKGNPNLGDVIDQIIQEGETVWTEDWDPNTCRTPITGAPAVGSILDETLTDMAGEEPKFPSLTPIAPPTFATFRVNGVVVQVQSGLSIEVLA